MWRPDQLLRSARIAAALVVVLAGPLAELAAQGSPRAAPTTPPTTPPTIQPRIQPVGADEDYEPFRLGARVAPPSWLKISGATRIRYEGISGQYRANPRLDFSDHVVVQRTTLRLDADLDLVRVTFEGIDSRIYGADRGSVLNPSNVNPVDILQAFVEFGLGTVLGGNHRLRVGRETVNLGSRRFVSRNGFRNTINSFTGVDWLWRDKDSTASTRAFFLLPVRRQPGELDRLVENDPELDHEDFDRRLIGLFHERAVAPRTRLEAYFLVLLEEGADTRRRKLFTPGFRLVRARKVGEFDWEADLAYQAGESRAATGGPDLDHFASFTHLSLGYTFDAPWTPHVRVAFDTATGDGDPADAENGRFDTLFGSRGFDYGRTGQFGYIARSNILSPEVRVGLRPDEHVLAEFSWRGLWLESETDAFTTAGVVDPTGNSGSHVGQKLDVNLRWDVLPASVRLEAGLAHVFSGEFLANAPNGRDTDTSYGYFQARWRF